ncbi:uncharacterized protein LOC124944651 isoform X2 [Impatiens glandulifera]|uniref:uncharacterized protein LOC124944651 isoform X2 n=1 Tax=Impatiens glandulifera TaxID=253017 RepID=UPI001FB06155|nr:uncharacterized protein LOC124944651 isoform X2 [Impatiens glandulifera]
MSASPRNEGGTQLLSVRVRKTIKSIKEIVGNHSDAEIYSALKEANMDPNETTQKLLNQDPFHEVKRKKDRKKENTGFKNIAEPKKQFDHAAPGAKVNKYPDRNNRRGGSNRDSSNLAVVNREFRVVRDNRANSIPNGEPTSLPPISTKEHVILPTSDKSSTGIFGNQKPSGVVPTVPIDGQPQGTTSTGTVGKELPKEKWVPVKANASHVQVEKLEDSKQRSAMQVPNQSVVGMYSSSSDPVHVPSPESRATSNVGAIKREVGVVGVRSLPLEKPAKTSSSQVVSISIPHARKDVKSSRESSKPVTAAPKIEPSNRASEAVAPVSSINKMVTNNQYNSRPPQQILGHQKASQTGKEWKPKSSMKLTTHGPGVIGTPTKAVPAATDNSKDAEKEDAEPSQDKDQPSRINENNVIIAKHIRVNESDRSQLIFGSFGKETDSSREFLSASHVGSEEKTIVDHSPRISSPPELPSSEESSVSNHVDLPHEPAKQSGPIPEQIAERKDTSSSQNLNNYADPRLYQDNNQSYAPLESQNQQYPSELSSFSAYDPQTGYDIPYFRPATDESVRGMGMSSSQEALVSHSVSPIPSTTLSMLQPPQMAQMYPQVHVSHFPNLMPYRQYLSPVYVPPMPMPAGYSTTPTFAHPTSGNSYMMMPGGNSHRLGMQQFKPVPSGSPTGFGNFTNPNGYAINPPTAVLDESSRMKYKDSNLYVPNQQGEASEIWIQNPRDHPGLQAASYYNMQGQPAAHGGYLSSHTGHGSFNPAGVTQSSHMQFPGLYHPAAPQQAGMANSHHLGANVVAGAAPPGAQVGSYQQQPQLGHHLNWPTNF